MIVYKLGRQYARLAATAGIAGDAGEQDSPAPSANLTIFADGRLVFASGPITDETNLRAFEMDVRNAEILAIRVSSNWDDNGDSGNDQMKSYERPRNGVADSEPAIWGDPYFARRAGEFLRS